MKKSWVPAPGTRGPTFEGRSDGTPVIDNPNELVNHGERELREHCLRILQSAWSAAEPKGAALQALQSLRNELRFCDQRFTTDSAHRVFFLGCGKASGGVAMAVEELLGPDLFAGLVVVPRGDVYPLRKVTVLESDHPLPTRASLLAGRRLLKLAHQARQGDLVICSITGGSSSLACVPPPGISMGQMRVLYRRLLESGADISEINTVRRHISRIKGGRLAQAIHPAEIWNITVSDVVDDTLEFISDPTVINYSNSNQALEVLGRYSLRDRIPHRVLDHFMGLGNEALPSLSGVAITNQVVISGQHVVDAMKREAQTLGYAAISLGTALRGESRGVAGALSAMARELSRCSHRAQRGWAVIGGGGEVTVRIDRRREWQCGGPNQELALAYGTYIPTDCRSVLAAVDSDGHDGGTAYAGGLVGSDTRQEAQAQGIDLISALRTHSSSSALESLGAAIRTGPTGTNVNDFLTVLVGHSSG